MLGLTLLLYLFDIVEYLSGYSDMGNMYNIFGDIFCILAAIVLLYGTLFIINYKFIIMEESK